MWSRSRCQRGSSKCVGLATAGSGEAKRQGWKVRSLLLLAGDLKTTQVN